MIILRQNTKSFSYASAKKLVNARSKVKDLGNRVMTSIDNAGLTMGNTLKEMATGKVVPKHHKEKFVRKSKEQLKRESIGDVRQITPKRMKRNINRLKTGAKDVANQVYYTPGQALDKGIKFAAENPISATGNAASVVLPAVNPIWAAIPVGGPSIAAEAGAKKISAYKRGTKWLGKKWSGSGLSKTLKSMGSLPETAGRVGSMVML